MPGWRDEFMDSVRESEKHNPVNRELMDTCLYPPSSGLILGFNS